MTTYFERPTAFTFNSEAASGAFYNKFLKALEETLTDIQDQVTAIAAAQAAADAADTKGRARMDDLPDVTITGDYTGTLSPSQLPLDITCDRYDGATSVTTSSTWAATVESGDVTCTIGAATGVLNVTAIGTDSIVLIESVRDGLTLRKRQAFKILLAAPPNTGGSGGTSWTDTTFNTINAATMAPISDELTVTVGASGTVNLSAPLSVSAAAVPPAAAGDTYGIWQWWDGAAWVDLGTEVQSDFAWTVTVFSGTYRAAAGSLSVPSSKTGLTPAASEKFRLMARNGTGTRTISFSGTATATSS